MSTDIEVMTFKAPAAFVRHLADNGLPRHRRVEERENFSIHYLDLSSLKILAGSFVPFVVLNSLAARPTLTAKEVDGALDELLQIRSSLLGEFVVLCVGGQVEPSPSRMRARLQHHRVAVLDRTDFDQIEALVEDLDERDARLAAALVRSLGRAALSPYTHGQVVYGERFFGRREDIKRALHSRGVATLAGSRRIGKTSMLREIRRELEVNYGDRLRVAEIYGSVDQFRNPINALGPIIDQLYVGQPDRERLATDPELPHKFASLVWGLIERAPRNGPRLEIAVFIDEFDELLGQDSQRGYALLTTLRNTFQGRPNCRLFFAGFRLVLKELVDQNSPLHNFGTAIELEGLSRKEATTMIQKPLRMLGIDIGDDLVHLIYEQTRGRPELIQVFCQEVLLAVEQSDEVPSSAELMDRVVSSPQFSAKIRGTFFQMAGPLEQLLSYLLIKKWASSGQPIDAFDFGFAQADELMIQSHVELEIADIDQLLGNLRLLSVIEAVPGSSRFRLAVPAFVHFLLTQDLNYLIRKALRKLGAIPSREWSSTLS